MCSRTFALPWLLILMLASPLWGQSVNNRLQGGTYNAPAGTGASTPFTPIPPLENPNAPFALPGLRFGQPPGLPSQSLMNPNQGLWWQLLQQPGQNGAAFAPGQKESKTLIKVIVPTAETQLWVNGQPTRQKGRERVFQTPPLEPGTYRYRFRASWLADNTPLSELQTVTFQPGTPLVVDFAKESRPQVP